MTVTEYTASILIEARKCLTSAAEEFGITKDELLAYRAHIAAIASNENYASADDALGDLTTREKLKVIDEVLEMYNINPEPRVEK